MKRTMTNLCRYIAVGWLLATGAQLLAKGPKRKTPPPAQAARENWIRELAGKGTTQVDPPVGSKAQIGAPALATVRSGNAPPAPLSGPLPSSLPTVQPMLPSPKLASPGSLYLDVGRYSDLARDMRASRKGDLITIVVSDQSSAVARGATSANRKSSASAQVDSLLGSRANLPALTNLANLGGESALDGAGSTSRSNTISTTLSGRIVDVLPSGDFLIEAVKQVDVNSEKQLVQFRGVVRWNDIGPSNLVRSDRIGQLELTLNGKGVVADAIRRPNIVYRILLGLLPF